MTANNLIGKAFKCKKTGLTLSVVAKNGSVFDVIDQDGNDMRFYSITFAARVKSGELVELNQHVKISVDEVKLALECGL